jgi:hypothetical protein
MTGHGPAAIGSAGDALLLLHDAGVDTRLLRRALIIAEGEQLTREYTVRSTSTVQILDGSIHDVIELDLVHINQALHVAMVDFVVGCTKFENFVSVLAATAPWAPLLQPGETIGACMARTLDFHGEVELALLQLDELDGGQ